MPWTRIERTHYYRAQENLSSLSNGFQHWSKNSTTSHCKKAANCEKGVKCRNGACIKSLAHMNHLYACNKPHQCPCVSLYKCGLHISCFVDLGSFECRLKEEQRVRGKEMQNEIQQLFSLTGSGTDNSTCWVHILSFGWMPELFWFNIKQNI